MGRGSGRFRLEHRLMETEEFAKVDWKQESRRGTLHGISPQWDFLDGGGPARSPEAAGGEAGSRGAIAGPGPAMDCGHQRDGIALLCPRKKAELEDGVERRCGGNPRQ